MTKKEIYAVHGIRFDDKHIYCDPLQRWIPRLLINGNKKIGRGVWHFSIVAGTAPVSTETVRKALGAIAEQWDVEQAQRLCGGTCACNCPGCYAQSGHYVKSNVRASLAWRSYLVRVDLEWVERAITAQIEADNIKMVRIHAAGDFCSDAYVQMWTRIAAAHPATIFWTYTKTAFKSLAAFDALENCNIVKSLIDGRVNYGTASYIMALYHELKAAGKSVWICRCGIDKNQHCNDCHHCYSAEYVLFLEHGTAYKPEQDPAFPAFVELVNSQIEEAAA